MARTVEIKYDFEPFEEQSMFMNGNNLRTGVRSYTFDTLESFCFPLEHLVRSLVMAFEKAGSRRSHDPIGSVDASASNR